MKQDGRFAFLYNPLFRVISTWVFWLVGASLVILIILSVYGFDLAKALEVLGEKRYLRVYVEIVSAGLLPLVLTLICKDDPTRYGLCSKGLAKSLLLSVLFVSASYGLLFLSTGQLRDFAASSFHLNFPWNLWYAALGVFAYGPLEVFFVIWLIENTDRIFKREKARVSRGLILTSVLIGLLHILTTQNVINTLVGVIFFLLGLIYKHTKNSIGPMVYWTLWNGAWDYVAILWS